jgi:hypothetical protein
MGVGTAAAQSPGPVERRTVADFLILVPERYIGYDLPFREELIRGEHRGLVVDIRNGYISYDASDNPSGFEFAIFRKSNGKYIIAYSDSVGDNFDSGEYTLLLLSYEGGRWRDVKKELLPVPFNKKLAYKLPRRGRSIGVTDSEGRQLYTLTWRNDRFHIKRGQRGR